MIVEHIQRGPINRNITPTAPVIPSNISSVAAIMIAPWIYSIKINKLLHGYKKDKDKVLISMTIFLIEKFFFILIKNNVKKIDMLINLKSSIVKKINDFTIYNLNISAVLHSIELKLRNVR